jgi:hypothetical protein
MHLIYMQLNAPRRRAIGVKKGSGAGGGILHYDAWPDHTWHKSQLGKVNGGADTGKSVSFALPHHVESVKN